MVFLFFPISQPSNSKCINIEHSRTNKFESPAGTTRIRSRSTPAPLIAFSFVARTGARSGARARRVPLSRMVSMFLWHVALIQD